MRAAAAGLLSLSFVVSACATTTAAEQRAGPRDVRFQLGMSAEIYAGYPVEVVLFATPPSLLDFAVDGVATLHGPDGETFEEPFRIMNGQGPCSDCPPKEWWERFFGRQCKKGCPEAPFESLTLRWREVVARPGHYSVSVTVLAKDIVIAPMELEVAAYPGAHMPQE